jgi:hypothetical protein
MESLREWAVPDTDVQKVLSTLSSLAGKSCQFGV